MSRVGIERTRMAIKNLGECEGEWKCAATDIPNMISVKSAAIGWTIRIEESEERAPLGSEKSELAFGSLKRVAAST